jgi:hypothetical protein
MNAEGTDETRPETNEIAVPKTEEIDVRELHYGALDVASVNYDWTEHEIGSDWEPYEAAECQECEHVSVDPGEERCPRCVAKGAEGYLDSREGPMMNYYYPLPGFSDDPREASARLVDLPLCLVRIGGPTEEDVWALALTGGGMDLRWEICEAFMRLGYLPPAHFADLPKMSGRGTSRRDRVIIRACLRSFDAVKSQAVGAARGLREMVAWARQRETENRPRKKARMVASKKAAGGVPA